MSDDESDRLPAPRPDWYFEPSPYQVAPIAIAATRLDRSSDRTRGEGGGLILTAKPKFARFSRHRLIKAPSSGRHASGAKHA